MTQHNLYSTGSRWGFALRIMQIFAFTLCVMQILAFLDTNMLAFPTRNCGIWGSKPTQGPNTNVFASQWNIGLRIVYAKQIEGLGKQNLHLEPGIMELRPRRILHLLNIMYHRSKNDAYLDKRDINTRQFQKVQFTVLKATINSVNYASQCNIGLTFSVSVRTA